jgi:glycosyltransferase involved in cell wall biosynthesis
MYPPRPLEFAPLVESNSPEPLRFALVTPVRDQQEFIGRTIQSVLDQHYGNLDYVVKEGASSDGTLSVASSFAGARVRVTTGSDRGLADGLNAGFAMVKGDVMGYLNGDDLLLPGTLHYIARFFSEHPEVDVVYGHRIIIDEADRDVGRWVLPQHSDRMLSWDDYIPQETAFWRKKIWDAAGARFDEELQFAVDWDLWLRFRECGARFKRLPRYLGAFRVHPAQKTATQMAGAGKREIEALRVRCLGRVPGALERALATGPYLFRHVLLSTADRVFGLYS